MPQQLRDASYKGAQRLGHGADYQYAHDFPGHFVAQDYLGAARKYYEPTEQGSEKKIKERLEKWREQFEAARQRAARRMNPKADLRRELRAALARLGETERATASAQARSLLRRQAVWRQARAVLFYAPIAGEIDLTALLEEAVAEGKAVALPGYVAETGTYEAFQVSDLGRDCVRGQARHPGTGAVLPGLCAKASGLGAGAWVRIRRVRPAAGPGEGIL